MIRDITGMVIVLALAAVLITAMPRQEIPEELQTVGLHYAENGVAETGSVNLVTAVVVAYRGLDTLGEVVVLFSASTAVVLILSLLPVGGKASAASPVVQLTARVMPGAIALFGVYVITHGHLSPGGGFPGGAVVASAFLLVLLGSSSLPGTSRMLTAVESLAGLSFGLLGFWGIYSLGQFLNNNVIPGGTPGQVISAGIIPFISLAIGAKVASELSGVFASYRNKGGKA